MKRAGSVTTCLTQSTVTRVFCAHNGRLARFRSNPRFNPRIGYAFTETGVRILVSSLFCNCEEFCHYTNRNSRLSFDSWFSMRFTSCYTQGQIWALGTNCKRSWGEGLEISRYLANKERQNYPVLPSRSSIIALSSVKTP